MDLNVMMPSAGQALRTPASTANGNPDPRYGLSAFGIIPSGPIDPVDVLARYLRRGEHPERVMYNLLLNAGAGRRVPPGVTVWDFVEEAVDGKGGFADGRYLWPFPLETEGNKLTGKLSDRMQMADYDTFAGHICDEYWNMIQGAREQIRRDIVDKRAEDILARFLRNCDRKGTSLTDFLYKPARQARMHGTGVVIVDREPFGEDATMVDDEDPDNSPYIVHVPMRNVVDWLLDDDGNLLFLTYVQPDPDQLWAKWHPIRVWTRDWCELFVPAADGTAGRAPQYVSRERYPNSLGRVPAVPFHNRPPDDGHFMGKTEMLSTAKYAQTVLNVDSYIHEILRKAGCPFLSINVQSVAEYSGDGVGGNTKAVIGVDNVVLWDGQAGEPKWIHPDLAAVIDPMLKTRLQKKDDAYGDASLRAIVGSIQTKSGFHAEVEFEKTENRIADFAKMLEANETAILIFVLAYYAIRDSDPGNLVTVSYPSRFNVQDREKLIERTAELLELNPGDEARRKIWSDLFQGLWPDTSKDDLEKMVQAAIAEAKAAPTALLQQIVQRAKQGAMVQRPPDPVAAGEALPSGGQEPPQ